MNVLLAIDGSKESLEAASFLAWLPLREKPIVWVLSVLQDYTDMEVASHWAEIEEQDAGRAFETVKGIFQSVGYECSHLTQRGHPSQTILSMAKKNDADLIVLGARGHSAIYRVIFGSTADFVANHAQCPVLVVRPNTSQPNTSQPNTSQPSAETDFQVMLAYDGSQYSRKASQQMFGLAWPASGTHIHVAMMLQRPKLVPSETDYDRDALDDAKQTLPNRIDAQQCQCDISYTVRETPHVGDSISDLVESKRINLLFVGAAGKSALARFFLGSTSRYLLHHVACSVWIARKKDWE